MDMSLRDHFAFILGFFFTNMYTIMVNGGALCMYKKCKPTNDVNLEVYMYAQLR